MIKRNFGIWSVVLLIVLFAAIGIVVFLFVRTAQNSENKDVIDYSGSISHEMLPVDFVVSINDEYCISKGSDDKNKNTGLQYMNVQEILYLCNIKTGERKEIYIPAEGHNTFRYVSNDNNVFWIEHGVKHDEVVSGEWKIMYYDLTNESIKEVDGGKVDDLNKYTFNEVYFGDPYTLFPTNLKSSPQNTIVYNRTVEENGKLYSQIVMYDLISDSKVVVAEEDIIIADYVYDVAINKDYVVYTKYHESNNAHFFGPSSYNYCDIFLYDIATKETKQITFNDFYVDVFATDDYLAMSRIPEKEERQDGFDRMQLVLYDMKSGEFQTVVTYQSPIYNNLNDLNVGEPKLWGNYLLWQGGPSESSMNIYDYVNKQFIHIPQLEGVKSSEILDATNDSLVIGGTDDNEGILYYKANLK